MTADRRLSYVSAGSLHKNIRRMLGAHKTGSNKFSMTMASGS